ncbi:MAG: vWA domain-containing protein, partial [Candidatus Sumerlaeia bacterium]|nr:vWA domain-containing protein [Candidatus Sumerlaeia bacterium]
ADRPFSVVAADINHDDRLDLLVPGWGNNRFLWYEQLYNNFYDDAPEADLNEKEIIFPIGSPFLFHARSVSRAYNTPRHMVAGDFNQDGCVDIVGTAQLDNSLILFTGKGFNVPGDNPSFTIVTPENGSTVFNENQTIITGEYSFNDKNPFAHDFMLLLDFSASTNFENNFEEIRTAALEFLYSLPYENVSAATEAKGAEKGYNYYELYDIQVGIILFRDTPEIALPLSFNVPAAISFLQNLEPTSLSNFTNIHDAINLGIQELSEKGQENSHRALYLISDGVQTQLDGWIAADASPYQIHTYSTGLPLFSLPFPDPALVEIGGGELLQDISFITGGNHAWGQDWLYFNELRIPNFFIDYIYMDVFFETTPGNFVYNNSYYPPYYNFDFGTFDQLVNSNLTEEGDLATKVIARMYLDGNGKGSELVAETTYYAEINVGPETPTAKPVLHAAVNLPTTDADGDEVFYKGYWSSSNGEGPINFGPTSETEFILREADGYTFDDGETWYLVLIACDDNGFESSQKYVLTFVIDLGVSMDILEP